MTEISTRLLLARDIMACVNSNFTALIIGFNALSIKYEQNQLELKEMNQRLKHVEGLYEDETEHKTDKYAPLLQFDENIINTNNNIQSSSSSQKVLASLELTSCNDIIFDDYDFNNNNITIENNVNNFTTNSSETIIDSKNGANILGKIEGHLDPNSSKISQLASIPSKIENKQDNINIGICNGISTIQIVQDDNNIALDNKCDTHSNFDVLTTASVTQKPQKSSITTRELSVDNNIGLNKLQQKGSDKNIKNIFSKKTSKENRNIKNRNSKRKQHKNKVKNGKTSRNRRITRNNKKMKINNNNNNKNNIQKVKEKPPEKEQVKKKRVFFSYYLCNLLKKYKVPNFDPDSEEWNQLKQLYYMKNEDEFLSSLEKIPILDIKS